MTNNPAALPGYKGAIDEDARQAHEEKWAAATREGPDAPFLTLEAMGFAKEKEGLLTALAKGGAKEVLKAGASALVEVAKL